MGRSGLPVSSLCPVYPNDPTMTERHVRVDPIVPKDSHARERTGNGEEKISTGLEATH